VLVGVVVPTYYYIKIRGWKKKCNRLHWCEFRTCTTISQWP